MQGGLIYSLLESSLNCGMGLKGLGISELEEKETPDNLALAIQSSSHIGGRQSYLQTKA